MISEKEIEAGARALVKYWLGGFENQALNDQGYIKAPYSPNLMARKAALDVLQAAEKARLGLEL